MGYLILFGAPITLLVAGYIAALGHGVKSPAGLAAVVAVGALAWLAYVALVPHSTIDDGQTVFGAKPRYGDDDAIILWPFVAMVVASAVAGWRQVAPALTIGAAAVLVPLALAYWTTPQGDEDGLWALIFVMLAMLGGFAALVAGIAHGVARHDEAGTPQRLASLRVGAVVIDAAAFALVAWWPGKALGDAGISETGGLAVGISAAIAFLAVPLMLGGATLGHVVLSLHVVDATTGARPTAVQAVARSAIIVAEFVVAPFVVGLTFIPEIVSIRGGNASLADAVCRTRVVRQTEGAAAERAKSYLGWK